MNEKNGNVDDVKGVPVSLQFNVVDADEARAWVATTGKGRFVEMREALVTHLRGLRKTEALSFPFDGDRKEIMAATLACKAACIRAGLRWRVRYSFSKKCIVVIHESKFVLDKTGNGKEST